MTDSFAMQLRGLRTDRGLTQKQLSEVAVGVSASYIALLETAQRRPSIETVTSIALALNCSKAERQALFDARDGVDGGAAPDPAHTPPVDVNSAARRMASAAKHYNDLNSEIDAITEQLGSQWAGASAAAYDQRLQEWRKSAAEAAAALTKMSDSLLMYAQRLGELDDAVARSLSDER